MEEVKRQKCRFAEQDWELLERITRGIIDNILSTMMKNLNDNKVLKQLETIKHLFGVESTSHNRGGKK